VVKVLRGWRPGISDRPPGAVAPVRRFRPDAKRASKPSFRLAASRSMSHVPSKLATFFLARWAFPGGTKTRPGRGRRRHRSSTTSPSRATDFAKKILDGPGLENWKSTYTERCRRTSIRQTPPRPHTYAFGCDNTGRLCRMSRICRTSRFDEDAARSHALHRKLRAKIGRCGLFQIELRTLGEKSPNSRLEAGVPRRARHSRDDRIRNVRRAINGDAERGAPPRQGDQFRHHLTGNRRRRHRLGIAREEPPPTIKKYFERFPGIRAYLWTRPANSAAKTVTSPRCFGRMLLSNSGRAASVRSFNDAPRSTPDAGSAADIIRRAMIAWKRRWREKKPPAQICCRCMTN